MTLSIFHTDCLVKTRNNYDPDPRSNCLCASTYTKYALCIVRINWIRDQFWLLVIS